jgi:hypothetical protein
LAVERLCVNTTAVLCTIPKKLKRIIAKNSVMTISAKTFPFERDTYQLATSQGIARLCHKTFIYLLILVLCLEG